MRNSIAIITLLLPLAIYGQFGLSFEYGVNDDKTMTAQTNIMYKINKIEGRLTGAAGNMHELRTTIGYDLIPSVNFYGGYSFLDSQPLIGTRKALKTPYFNFTLNYYNKSFRAHTVFDWNCRLAEEWQRVWV